MTMAEKYSRNIETYQRDSINSKKINVLEMVVSTFLLAETNI